MPRRELPKREDKLTINNFPSKREPAIRFEPRQEVEKKPEQIAPKVPPVSIDSESLERFSINKKKGFWDKKWWDFGKNV